MSASHVTFIRHYREQLKTQTVTLTSGFRPPNSACPACIQNTSTSAKPACSSHLSWSSRREGLSISSCIGVAVHIPLLALEVGHRPPGCRRSPARADAPPHPMPWPPARCRRGWPARSHRRSAIRRQAPAAGPCPETAAASPRHPGGGSSARRPLHEPATAARARSYRPGRTAASESGRHICASCRRA